MKINVQIQETVQRQITSYNVTILERVFELTYKNDNMKKNISTLKNKIAGNRSFISIKGGMRIIEGSNSGCVNTKDCSTSTNATQCQNMGVCKN